MGMGIKEGMKNMLGGCWMGDYLWMYGVVGIFGMIGLEGGAMVNRGCSGISVDRVVG